jgi:hypothetical protein
MCSHNQQIGLAIMWRTSSEIVLSEELPSHSLFSTPITCLIIVDLLALVTFQFHVLLELFQYVASLEMVYDTLWIYTSIDLAQTLCDVLDEWFSKCALRIPEDPWIHFRNGCSEVYLFV